MTYIAEIGGSTIQAGDSISISHISGDIEIEILEIFSDSFSVKWLNGKQKGATDILHFDLFGFGIGNVKSYKVSDDPNTVFRRKKRGTY